MPMPQPISGHWTHQTAAHGVYQDQASYNSQVDYQMDVKPFEGSRVSLSGKVAIAPGMCVWHVELLLAP
jgi:hypothetical protein